MDRLKFEELLEEVVRPVGESIRAKNEVVWNQSTDWASNAYNIYESVRSTIRYDMRLDDGLGDHKIDRHKIAAALSYALVRTGPLRPTAVRAKPGARLANVQLAIYSSIHLIIHFVEERLACDEASLGKLNGVPFQYPPAHDGHYVVHLSKSLLQACKKQDRYDPYLVANLYFLMEAYHLKHCGIGSLPDVPCDAEACEN